MARLGMPSLPLLGGLDAHARLCLELGLSFVELNMNLPAFHANALDASALRAWMRQGVDFTLHLDERLDRTMKAVEASYEKNKERWVDALFSMIVGVEPS